MWTGVSRKGGIANINCSYVAPWVGSHGCITSVLQLINVDLPIAELAQPVLPGDQMSLERTVWDSQHPGVLSADKKENKYQIKYF